MLYYTICNCIIGYIGDSDGKLHVMKISHEFGNNSDSGGRKRNQLLLDDAIKNMISFKAHDNWVTNINYISEIDSLVTSGLDGIICLIDIFRGK